jgi:PAS domain S-box-containing protein
MKILVAEDIRTHRQWLETILTEWGHDVVTVCDGDEAWQTLSQKDAPQLVILDWVMPGMDGAEVCRKFREMFSSSPTYIIMLTAKTKKEDLITGFQAGVDDYLIKPVDPDELLARIQSGMRVIELQGKLCTHAEELEQEIAERKRVEKALRESEARYRTLFEQANDAIILENINEEIVDVNRRACQLLDYSREELLTMKISDLETDLVRLHPPLEAHLEPNVTIDGIFETLALRRDGTHIPIEVTLAPLTGPDDTLFLSIIRDVAERRRAEQSLQRRNLELTVLNTVAQTLSSTLELDRVLERVLDELQRVIPYDQALISLLPDASLSYAAKSSGHALAAWVVAARGLEYTPLPQKGFILDEFPLLQRIVQNGSPIIVPDVRHEPDWVPAAGLDLVQSWLGVPFILRNRVSGILMINSHYTHAYDQDAAHLASAFAHQAALAIENSRLYGQMRAQLREALLLHSVTAALSSTLDIDLTLPYVTRSLCEILNSTSARIYSLDQETNAITVVTHYASSIATKEERRADVDQTYALDDLPVAAESLARNRPIQIHVNNPELDPRERAMLENHNIQSALFLPMIAPGHTVVGLAVVWESQGPHHFTQGEIATGQTLTHQAAIVIEHARLFTETQKNAQQLEALYRTSRALSSSLKEEPLLHTILEAVYRVLNCKYVLIAIVDEDAQTISIRHGIWDGEFDAFPTWIPTTPYPLDHPHILADVYRTGRVETIEEWDERFNRETWEQFVVTNGGSQFLRIFMPIKMRDRIIGVVEVGYTRIEKDPIAKDDIQMLTALVDQAAAALENARLFKEARQRVREMEFLHEVSLAAATEIRLQDILQGAAESLAAELGNVRVSLLLLELESGVLRMEAGVGYPANLIGNLYFELDQGISGWVVKHGQPVIAPDVWLDPRYYKIIPDTRSELCVPMTVGSLTIGALNIESPQLNAFTNNDLRLLSTLANNLAAIIERVHLFNAVEAARIESQQRAQALAEANARLQELDRLKDQFLASVSHELRTPLNSIIGFSDVLMKRMAGEISSKQEECVRNILLSGEHLMALINDILDLSKIKAGRMSLELGIFDVHDLLTEVQTTIMPLVNKKSQALTIEHPDGLPPLTADRFRIKQVLLNLLSNANKFTPIEGRITVSCRVSDPEDSVLFSVADTGAGIRPNDQEIIFEEFRQAGHDPAEVKVKGTGLGLAISKRLVEMHKGRIWVESQYGHGATFFFLLPLAGPPTIAPSP